MDFLNHWRLRERPFEATWDTRFFFQGAEHQEAVERLLYLVRENSMGLGLLSGEIGCGKTLTRAVFSERLSSGQFQVITLENSGFAFKDLLGAILNRLDTGGNRFGQTKFERCEQFERALRKLREEGRHLVILLDEAQDMPPATLRELRWLTNFNGSGRAFLTMILIGQPEVRPHVTAYPAINQRIGLRFHLRPLLREQSADYLSHRLATAGHPNGSVFSEESAGALFDATRGVPRELNRLAKLALEFAWLRDSQSVSLDSIRAVVADLEKHQAMPVT